eukprot:CAMPEP_0202695908 /NCGR_PEP_ID=MMETSP1385-20130828/9347_1 /ASSEMBLY_ACC=CAM_ASM_000861 /TAXON_ID=933848 /ORGANISM="Elphidium margaritaceum" /LENGTH=566 /DNA_ID=CAMNT_0049351989 /DNA_START=403 /DNA_END=2103 /DNA_ORIENTATION=-
MSASAITTIDENAQQRDTRSQKLLSKSQFYINNRDTLGNWKRVLLVNMCLIFPLIVLLSDVLPYFILDSSRVQDVLILKCVQIGLCIAIFVFVLNLILRIHKISDKYWIGAELMLINICFTVFSIVGRVVNIALFVALQQHPTRTMQNALVLCTSICTMFSLFCAIYFASFWVLRRLFVEYSGTVTLKQARTRQSKMTRFVRWCTMLCFKTSTEKEEQKRAELAQHQLTLNRVLSSQKGFELFTQFLISELAVENILFLVEVKQYKARCRQYHKKESKTPKAIAAEARAAVEAEAGTRSTATLPSLSAGCSSEPPPGLLPKLAGFGSNVMSLRPSTTTHSKPDVFQSKSVMTVDYVPTNSELQSLPPWEYALYLYNKYIKVGSDLEINLPFKERRKLKKFLIESDRVMVESDDAYTTSMFTLYDKAWEQILVLINQDSYSRFKKTPEYESVWKATKHEDDEKKQRKKDNQNERDTFLYQMETHNTILQLDDLGVEIVDMPIPEEAEVDPPPKQKQDDSPDVQEEEQKVEDEEDMEEDLAKLDMINVYSNGNDAKPVASEQTNAQHP